jgi:regulator of sigma E protease
MEIIEILATALVVLLLWLIVVISLAVHELGHYLAARHFGIGVKSVTVGMGPTLWRAADVRGVLWTLRLLPLSGSVTTSENEFLEAGPAARFWVSFAGPFANLLPAFLIVAFLDEGIARVWSFASACYSEILSLLWAIMIFPSTLNLDRPGVDVMGIFPELPMVISGFIFLNVLLAMWNLIPLPPFDGGRCLMAGVQKASPRAEKVLSPALMIVGILFSFYSVVVVILNAIMVAL